MNQEPLVKTILCKPDPDNNTQPVTLVVPADADPEDAKETLLNAVWGPAALSKKGTNMDPAAKTPKVSLKAPDHVDPMVAKQMLRNALRDPVAVEAWRVELSKIEKESK